MHIKEKIVTFYNTFQLYNLMKKIKKIQVFTMAIKKTILWNQIQITQALQGLCFLPEPKFINN